MFIHGARSVLLQLKRHPDQAKGWLVRIVNRRNPNVATVALANKNARIVRPLLASCARSCRAPVSADSSPEGLRSEV